MEATGPISAQQPSAFSEVQHLRSTSGHHVPALHLVPHGRAVQVQGVGPCSGSLQDASRRQESLPEE